MKTSIVRIQTQVTAQELTKTITDNMQWGETTSNAYYNQVIDYTDHEGRIRAQIVKERSGNVYYLWKTDLTDKNLQEAATMFNKYQVTKQEAQEYCDKWNKTQGRFTTAKIVGHSILNVYN